MNIERWKEQKKELGWTHDQLAEKSGVSRRTIAGIFSGDARYESPTWNTVQAIEKALGLAVNPPKDAIPMEITPLEEEFIRELRKHTEEEQQFFLVLLKKLK